MLRLIKSIIISSFCWIINNYYHNERDAQGLARKSAEDTRYSRSLKSQSEPQSTRTVRPVQTLSRSAPSFFLFFFFLSIYTMLVVFYFIISHFLFYHFFFPFINTSSDSPALIVFVARAYMSEYITIIFKF